MDILCHVQEFVPFWTAQTLQVVRHPDRSGDAITPTRPVLPPSRTPPHGASLTSRPGFATAVRQSAEALEQLSDADLAIEATSTNPRWGLKPASFIVDHLLVQHVAKHWSDPTQRPAVQQRAS